MCFYSTRTGDRRNRQSVAISPRAGLLLEMYDAEESVFNQSLSAFRLGDYKLIRGPVRDDNYYYESSTNKINCSHVSLGSMVIETIVDLNDFLFGKGQSDTLNIMMAHLWMPDLITLTDTWFPAPTAYINQRNGAIGEEDAGHHEATDLRLYNIAMDPCERYNLAGDPQYAAIIAAIDQEVSAIAAHRPHVLPLDVQLDISLGGAWSKHHVSGDCDINPSIPKEHCRFTHSWVPDVSADDYTARAHTRNGTVLCTLCTFLAIVQRVLNCPAFLPLTDHTALLPCHCYRIGRRSDGPEGTDGDRRVHEMAHVEDGAALWHLRAGPCGHCGGDLDDRQDHDASGLRFTAVD